MNFGAEKSPGSPDQRDQIDRNRDGETEHTETDILQNMETKCKRDRDGERSASEHVRATVSKMLVDPAQTEDAVFYYDWIAARAESTRRAHTDSLERKSADTLDVESVLGRQPRSSANMHW